MDDCDLFCMIASSTWALPRITSTHSTSQITSFYTPWL